MENVILTKEQDETLKEMFSKNWSKREILTGHDQAKYTPWERYKELNNLEFDTLAKALYIGYEIKREPEKLVLELYQHEKEGHNVEAHVAIKSTLDLLGIEIEGVNK